MKILFVTTHFYLPQSYGGLSISLDQLCRGLLDKGHTVTVLAGIRRGGIFAWKSLVKRKTCEIITGHKISCDTGLGYRVWRAWIPSDEIEHVASKEKPNLIVVMGGKVVPSVLAARRIKIPVLAQVHDVEFYYHGGDFKDLGDISCVANSNFTAETYHRTFGVTSTVVYPFISPEKYRTKSTKENVTFINPYLHKGCNIALEIARRCPEIPFSFIGKLPLIDEHGQKLAEKLSALPNVQLLPPRKDMRAVYSKCKILLVPSVWEEAYGRVVTEAQISGIPIVASTRGGLPESVGPGGILVNPDGPIDDWTKAIRKLWQDDKYYTELSVAALAYAQRPEMSFSYQIDAHEKALLAACEGQ